MHPLGFEEFLWANGFQKEAIKDLKAHFVSATPLDFALHDRLMHLFRLYLIVGGMPEAVAAYLKTKDLSSVRAVHKKIVSNYHLDISSYLAADVDVMLIKDIYDLIPSELNKENKRFFFSSLGKRATFERLSAEFLWLREAGVSLPCFNVREPRTPLMASQERSLFKLFSSDVGMLVTSYGVLAARKILALDSSINKGAIFENFVAQELTFLGFPLYYWNRKKEGEADFLIESEEEVIPLEVKSGKDYVRHSALDHALKGPYGIKKAYVLHDGNVKADGSVIYLPIYMAMFLNPEEKIAVNLN
jgi:predicted AAA+ superfamily ATPase